MVIQVAVVQYTRGRSRSVVGRHRDNQFVITCFRVVTGVKWVTLVVETFPAHLTCEVKNPFMLLQVTQIRRLVQESLLTSLSDMAWSPKRGENCINVSADLIDYQTTSCILYMCNIQIRVDHPLV